MSQTDQFTELAELAGGFIHEIKNHVSTLALNLQLLSEDFSEPQNQRERRALDRVTRLQKECDRLVGVSNDFLRFARAEELKLQPESLDDVVSEMVDFISPTAKNNQITITFYPSGSSQLLSIDRDLFKQALLNLLLNAEQAIGDDGGEIILQIHAESEAVTLDVIDTGQGIPPDVLPKLFRPFHTTKPGGTGLGLPTTRKIIVAHGGTISVQSELGRGTKFSIRLPIPTQKSLSGIPK
jgi:two-component system, NtrC family, sensor histidine kinase HydH